MFLRHVGHQKAIAQFHVVITYTTSANEISIQESRPIEGWHARVVWSLTAWTWTAFWRQTWRQKTMPDMASGFPSTDYSVPCLAPFFDAMSGVKKLWKVHAVSDYQGWAGTRSKERAFLERVPFWGIGTWNAIPFENWERLWGMNSFFRHLKKFQVPNSFLWKIANFRDNC